MRGYLHLTRDTSLEFIKMQRILMDGEGEKGGKDVITSVHQNALRVLQTISRVLMVSRIPL